MTEGGMVNRCAKAAFERAMQQPYGDVTRRWDEMGDAQRYWIDTTRAVIEAMMEPTPAMRVAGAHVHDQRPSEAAAVFQAMLRTALSQPNEEGEGK